MQPSVVSTEFISWIVAMSITATALGIAVYVDCVAALVKRTLTKVRSVLMKATCYVKSQWEGLVSPLEFRGLSSPSVILASLFSVL